MKLTIRNMLLVSLFAALTCVGAYITIPLGFTPVPLTLQLFFTFLAGVVLGGRLGALSQLIYVLLGSFGLPVFAGGAGGIRVLIGPTAGYLLGFIVAAFVTGKIVEAKKKPGAGWITLACLAGLVTVYVLGVSGFLLVLKVVAGKTVTLGTALTLTVVPFLPLDLFKACAAALIGARIWGLGRVHK